MSTTPRTDLPLLAAAQAQKHVTHNEALLQLDALLFARFLDRDLTAPPASPSDGDTYLVASPASGDWTGAEGKIAFAVDGAWRLYDPFTGLAAFVVDESKLIVFNGTAWVDYASILTFQNVPLFGVNTTADTTNRLAVKSSALLFDNVGNGIQAKLNKHASGDTASLLYQTNYSGRAEMGLAGDDNFHLKVSPDGSAWYEGLDIAGADGGIDFLASEASLASAATVDIGGTASLRALVTGTTAITSFGSHANKLRFVRFSGALTLTHNATGLILLGGASRTTAANDVGIYTSDASGNWRERSYRRAASDPGDAATKSGSETLTNKTLSGATLSGTTTLPGSGAIGSGGSIGLGRSPTVPLDVYTSSNGVISLFAMTNASSGSGSDTRFTWNNDANYAGFAFTGSNHATPNRLSIFTSLTTAPIQFANSGAVALYAVGGNVAIGGASINSGAKLDVAGHVFPHADNSYNLGSASFRWGTVYAGTGTINTSGAATKTGVRALSAAEIAAARALAGGVKLFQFADAVAVKGPAAARLHAGTIYEDVAAAFAAHGLDPFAYGIVCRDPSASGEVFGLRYGELAQFVLAGLAARLDELEARFSQPPLNQETP